eukprot:1110538-Heterocapsa_arctica.AAC.1
MDDTQMDGTAGTDEHEPRSDGDLDVSYSDTCPCTTCAAQRRARAAAAEDAANEADEAEVVYDSTQSEGEVYYN